MAIDIITHTNIISYDRLQMHRYTNTYHARLYEAVTAILTQKHIQIHTHTLYVCMVNIK